MSTVGNVGMKSLIPVVNEIQDLCTQVGTGLQFDLPQIAVVGSQSTGKSSVLEGFVGRDFLPRGSGIVTRRPLILQLINEPECEEYGEFLHCKDKKFTDFDEIRAEIESETDRDAGNKQKISDNPINLRIYSPNVLNLTLVDLPGITKVAVGDQPADIEKKVRKMILKYIENPNCLILAVSPANADLATSEALKLAKEVDKKGTRTIGVITKLDLMDAGTDARDILENKVIPLHRGYIGVVNRSQQNINDKKDILKALEDERDFFMQHPYYRDFADCLGIPFLQKMLNRTLTEHIREKLPGLRDNLRKREISLKHEIDEYEKLHPNDVQLMKTMTLAAVHKLQLDFKRELGSLSSNVIDTNRLSSGAKIRRIFHKQLPNEIAKIKLDKGGLRRKILFAIENLYGIDSMVYAPFKAFEAIVREQISLLKRPIMICLDLVIDELSKAVRNCTSRMTEYPAFREKIENMIIAFIHSNTPECTKNILALIDMQSEYINAKHDDFAENRDLEDVSEPSKVLTVASNGFKDAIASVPHDGLDDEDDDVGPTDVDVHGVFNKIAAYMQIVEKTTVHMVPKAIILYIIRKVEKFITTDLLVQIVDGIGENDAELLAADQETVEKYVKNKEMHAICTKALDILNNIQIGKHQKKASTSAKKIKIDASIGDTIQSINNSFPKIDNLEYFPEKVLLQIFSKVDDIDLLNLAETSYRFGNIAKIPFKNRYANQYFVIDGDNFTEDKQQMYEELFSRFGRSADIRAIAVEGIENIDKSHWLTQILGQYINRLEELDLSQCTFDKIEDFLSSFLDITHLTISGTKNDPHLILPHYRNLIQLELKSVQISDEMLKRSIQNSTALESLIVRDCSIEPSGMIELIGIHLPNLKELILNRCTFDKINDFLPSFPEITDLMISINGDFLPHLILPHYRNLTKLELNNVEISDEMLKRSIQNSTALKSLIVRDCNIEPVGTTELIGIHLPNLKELILNRCSFEEINDFLSSFPDISDLTIKENFPPHLILPHYRNLTKLELNRVEISDEMLKRSIQNSTALKSLIVRDCSIEPSGMIELIGIHLPNLKELILLDTGKYPEPKILTISNETKDLVMNVLKQLESLGLSIRHSRIELLHRLSKECENLKRLELDYGRDAGADYVEAIRLFETVETLTIKSSDTYYDEPVESIVENLPKMCHLTLNMALPDSNTFILDLLRKFPKLKTITIYFGYTNLCDLADDWFRQEFTKAMQWSNGAVVIRDEYDGEIIGYVTKEKSVFYSKYYTYRKVALG